MKNNKFLLLLFLFTSHLIYPQLSSAEIDSLVQEAMNTFKVAGAAVAVVKDGKVVHQKGYGVQSIKTKELSDQKFQFCYCFQY
ncbi:serine hydrolase [Antarcticibacterium sp. 1MA-6-2]|uniref:serine hydrolase n=1 Tax=Antarcticibacterium sp. 1MA-6-2 TaxID=2908210 RepID=UPI002103A22A|nr:serine hydrolase [Antarcticibacterium sp. 1MA-6-2]